METKTLWNAAATGAGFAAAWATRRTLVSVWRQRRDSEPPANPEVPSTGWGEAAAWAAFTGMAVGMARLLARRGAAAGWRRAAGDRPPGLEEGG